MFRRCTLENRYARHLRKSIFTGKRETDNSDWMETVRNCGHEICISFITLARGLQASVKKNKKRKIENTIDTHSSWWQWSYLYGYLKVFFFSRAESLRDDKFEPVEQTGYRRISTIFQFFFPLPLSPVFFLFYVRLSLPCPLHFKDIVVHSGAVCSALAVVYGPYNPSALNRGYPVRVFFIYYFFSFFLSLYKCP